VEEVLVARNLSYSYGAVAARIVWLAPSLAAVVAIATVVLAARRDPGPYE
jgi:hypothetical protein